MIMNLTTKFNFNEISLKENIFIVNFQVRAAFKKAMLIMSVSMKINFN